MFVFDIVFNFDTAFINLHGESLKCLSHTSLALDDDCQCFHASSTNTKWATGDVVTSRRDIACAYMRRWFWVDLLSTFPFHLLSFSTIPGVNDGGHRLPRLLRLMRLVSSHTLSSTPVEPRSGKISPRRSPG